MIPIPWLIGGVAAYLLLTGKARNLLIDSGQETAPVKENNSLASSIADWFSPPSQTNTANGAQNTVGDVANAVGAVAGVVGKFVDWFNPPNSQSTSGAASTAGGSGTSGGTVPPYLSNSSKESYDSGFNFWG